MSQEQTPNKVSLSGMGAVGQATPEEATAGVMETIGWDPQGQGEEFGEHVAESEHDSKLPSLANDEAQHEAREKQQEASLPAKVEAAEAAAASSFDARGVSPEPAAKELPTFRAEMPEAANEPSAEPQDEGDAISEGQRKSTVPVAVEEVQVTEPSIVTIQTLGPCFWFWFRV